MSEAFLLRTYPFREADLIVSFFTRDSGKLRGVARRARRPKSPFGAALERLSRVRVTYFLKEHAELASLHSAELIESPFAMQADYPRSVALDYFTEISEQLLPPHEANERFFRLLQAVLDHLSAGGAVWPAVAYFSLWAVRLSGFLPQLRVSRESARIAEEMFVTPIGGLAPREWSKSTASDLRRALVRAMEQHLERRLLTVPLLEAL